MKSFLGVPIVVRGKPYGNLYLTEKEGGDEFDEQDEEAVVVLADWAAIAIENARGYSALEERREELERLVSTFDASTEIAHALAGGTDLDRILELVVKRGRAPPTRARRWCCSNRATSWWSPRWRASSTTRSSANDSHRRDRRRPGAPHRDGRASGRRPRTPAVRARRADERAERALRPAARSEAARWASSPRSTAFADGPRFSAWDEQVLSGFAASAASAVARARDMAAQMLRRSIESAEQERGRWARELHDETLQELAAAQARPRRRAGAPERCGARRGLDTAAAGSTAIHACGGSSPTCARRARRPWPRARNRDAGGARPPARRRPSFRSSWSRSLAEGDRLRPRSRT